MPIEAREVTGWILSRGHDHGLAKGSLHLGIGGTKGGQAGSLIVQIGGEETLRRGTGKVPRWSWQHVAIVATKGKIAVYRNGKEEIRVETDAPKTFESLFFGGRCDSDSNWEGRLDEISVYDRALTEKEIATLAGLEQ